jgi:hypothetical protein
MKKNYQLMIPVHFIITVVLSLYTGTGKPMVKHIITHGLRNKMSGREQWVGLG